LPKRRSSRNYKVLGLLGVVVVGLVVTVGYLAVNFSPCRNLPYPPISGTLVLHNHDILKIYVNDQEILVPYGVGEGDGACPQPLHNHADHPEVIHIEESTFQNVTLANYFNVWARTPNLVGPSPVVFNSTQILGYKAGNGYEVRMFVNGQQSTDYQTLVLSQHQTIVIAYGNTVTESWATYQGISGQPWPYSNI
jgi:hypothetical protein